MAASSTAALWVTVPGTTPVPAGVARVYVNAGAAVTLQLPANDVLVMDRGPQAGAFPITVTPPGGATINGNPSFVLVDNWAAVDFVFDGVNFGVD